ncbi:MAG: hypothetical protein CMH54_03530 [Myxococcales bacterium]|nr:hypothetical protein [Myxococcales bacterium]
MKKAQILTIIGGLLVLVSAVLPWMVTPNLPVPDPKTPNVDALASTGIQIQLGLYAAIVAVICIATALFTMVKRNKRLLILNNLIGALVIMALAAMAFWYAPSLLADAEPYISHPDTMGFLEPSEYIIGGMGYYLALIGALAIIFASCMAYAARPEYKLGVKALRVEARWRGEVLKEMTYLEPESVSVGEDLKASFVVPESSVGRYHVLFQPHGRSGEYSLNLNANIQGDVSIGGKVADVKTYLKDIGGVGTNPITVGGNDFGVLNFGELELVFRFVNPEQQIARVPMWKTFDHAVAAGLLISFFIQGGGVSSFVIFSPEAKPSFKLIEARDTICKPLSLVVEVKGAEPPPEELFDLEEEEEEDTGKKAGGEEGKFGDPDEDPEKESQIPKNQGKMVERIDPKKVGLADALTSNSLMGEGALSDIMSNDQGVMMNRLAQNIAMAGPDGGPFVIGHGTGGLGFKGSGTGGGGSGLGRIHGLGKIDGTGGTGRRVRSGMGRKKKRRVGKIRVGRGDTAGFCKKDNIAKAVRRRAGAIRSCYEKQLMINPSLKGKLIVQWKIGLDGRVKSANAKGGSLKDPKVVKCVVRTIRGMRFAKPDGGVCVVRWPFVFNNG